MHELNAKKRKKKGIGTYTFEKKKGVALSVTDYPPYAVEAPRIAEEQNRPTCCRKVLKIAGVIISFIVSGFCIFEYHNVSDEKGKNSAAFFGAVVLVIPLCIGLHLIWQRCRN